MAFRFPFRCKSTSSTTGTGTYTLSEPTSAGWRNLTRAVTDGDLADGDTVAYIVVDTTVVGGPKLCEVGTGVWNNTAKTLTRATVLQPNGAAVNWGAGTRDVYIVHNPTLYLLAANNLSDLNSIATAVVNLGVKNDARTTLNVSQTGGTVGKFVRMTTTANTWTDASQADTNDQLALVAFKEATGVYVLSGRVTLSSLTAGSPYYLSTAGGFTITAPTPSSSVRRRMLGVAINTTELAIVQSIAIGG